MKGLDPEGVLIKEESRIETYDEVTRERFDLLERATPQQIMAASRGLSRESRVEIDYAWQRLRRMVDR